MISITNTTATTTTTIIINNNNNNNNNNNIDNKVNDECSLIISIDEEPAKM